MPTTPDRLLTTHDVGRILQMDPSSVVKWINDGILPAYRTPGRHRRVKTSDLLRFMRERGMYVSPELQAGTRRVLVVDDDPKALKALERGLKGDGLEVETSLSAIDALVRIGAQPPDVLVIDIDMPGLGGLEGVKRLKANPATAGVVVVVVSAKVTPELEKKARAAGARVVVGGRSDAALIKASLAG